MSSIPPKKSCQKNLEGINLIINALRYYAKNHPKKRQKARLLANSLEEKFF